MRVHEAREPGVYLALDQGGHASRAVVFDKKGERVTEARREVGTQRPSPGRVEHDVEDVVASLRGAAADAIAKLGDRRRELKALGLACQRSNLVAWDRHTGTALSPVVSWQDRRGAPWLEARQLDGDRIHELTGLVCSPHYGASKLRWCLDHLDAVKRAHAEGRLAWGPLASYLLYRLVDSRPFVTDPSHAQRTLLWNLTHGDWEPELVTLFQLEGGQLPGCGSTIDEFGDCTIDGTQVPFQVLIGDQAAALFAHGRPSRETAFINMGTGAFVQCVRSGPPRPHPRLLTSVLYRLGAETLWAREGSVHGAGAALKVVASDLKVDAVEDRLAEWWDTVENPPLFLNGVSGLGSPYWIPHFDSRFVGDGGVPAKIVSVLESMLFLLAVNLEHFDAPYQRIQVSGGLSRNDGLCQRLANLTGVPVLRPDDLEATARGVAWLLAGEPPGWSCPERQPFFTPAADPGVRERYRRWRELMPDCAG